MKFQVGDLVRALGYGSNSDRILVVLDINRSEGNPIMFWDIDQHFYCYGDHTLKVLLFRAGENE